MGRSLILQKKKTTTTQVVCLLLQHFFHSAAAAKKLCPICHCIPKKKFYFLVLRRIFYWVKKENVSTCVFPPKGGREEGEKRLRIEVSFGSTKCLLPHSLTPQPPTVVCKMEVLLECIHIAYTPLHVWRRFVCSVGAY